MRIASIHVMLMTMNDRKSANALYTFTVPAFIRMLKVVNAILVQAERHAKREKIEPATLLAARLYPNMFTLLQQIQYLCFLPVDFAKNFSTSAAPRVGYDETTFADLKASIKQTIKYLQTLKPSQFAVQEDRQLPLFFDQSSGLTAEAYATRVILPDFYFHATIAYAILRHNGLPLGKMDFFGPLDAKPLAKKKK